MDRGVRNANGRLAGAGFLSAAAADRTGAGRLQPVVTVSVGGNDIVVDQSPEGAYVLFLTSRSIRHYFSGFLHVPPGGDPAKFFEYADKPPTRQVQYGKDWYFVAN
jgi:hypothetical protein